MVEVCAVFFIASMLSMSLPRDNRCMFVFMSVVVTLWECVLCSGRC